MVHQKLQIIIYENLHFHKIQINKFVICTSIFQEQMNIQNLIENKVKEGFLALYQTEIPTVEFQATRKEFEGDITVVVFPMLRYKKGNPVQIGEDLGNIL